VQPIEFLYWKFVWSALDGKLADAEQWIAMMKAESQEDPESFKVLKKDQLEIITRFRTLVEKGESPRYLYKRPTRVKQVNILAEDSPFDEEAKLNKFFFHNSKGLGDCLGLENFRIGRREAKTFHGQIDLLGESDRLTVVVELKLGQANHAVITQLEKYMRDEYKRLHYGTREDVLGVVIAADYSDFAREELKKLNAVALKCTMRKDTLSLLPLWPNS
jgi:hypothetical protein